MWQVTTDYTGTKYFLNRHMYVAYYIYAAWWLVGAWGKFGRAWALSGPAHVAEWSAYYLYSMTVYEIGFLADLTA